MIYRPNTTTSNGGGGGGLSLVEQKKRQWAREKGEITSDFVLCVPNSRCFRPAEENARLGEVSTSLTHQQHQQHTHSTTSSSVLSRSGASHQVEQRTSIRTYYSQADLSMVTAVRPSSPSSLASEAAATAAAASQAYVSVRNGDGIYEDAGYYEAAGGHVVDRVRSPSLPPLGRLNRSGGR